MFLSDMSLVDCLTWALHRSRYMFYLVTPSETTYSHVQFVPRLVVEVSPCPATAAAAHPSLAADVPLLHPAVLSGEWFSPAGRQNDLAYE